MPEALSIEARARTSTTGRRATTTTEIYTGWAYPPKDYAKWGELVYQWARHCVERYGQRGGRELVLGGLERAGHRLLARHARGVPQAVRLRRRRREARAADGAGRRPARHRPERRADAAVPARLPRALPARHELRDRQDRLAARLRRLPRQGRAARSSTATCGWASATSCARSTTASRSSRRSRSCSDTPIVIGESDPEGCAACSVADQPGERLPQRHDVFELHRRAARADVRAGRRHGVNLRGAVTWAFEFEDQPYFAGFRDLATNGIDKPVLNVFRMFGQMGGERLAVDSSGALPLDAIRDDGVRDAPDVAALASRERAMRSPCCVWNYHDDDVPAPAAADRADDRRRCPPRHVERHALPRRRRPQQRLRGVEADGVAAAPFGAADPRVERRRPICAIRPGAARRRHLGHVDANRHAAAAGCGARHAHVVTTPRPATQGSTLPSREAPQRRSVATSSRSATSSRRIAASCAASLGPPPFM